MTILVAPEARQWRRSLARQWYRWTRSSGDAEVKNIRGQSPFTGPVLSGAILHFAQNDRGAKGSFIMTRGTGLGVIEAEVWGQDGGRGIRDVKG